nr:RNA polymerase alpha subunit [Chlorokybus atmophyticus]
MAHQRIVGPTIECIESRIESRRNHYGRFVIAPLEIGQGITVGNVFRRVLLGDLEGACITSVQIPGVNHEFSTIHGVREAVLDILLNLKEIVLKTQNQETQRGHLSVQGPSTVLARDLQLPSSIELVDPDQYIATISGRVSLNMEFTVEVGKGYQLPDYEKKKTFQVDVLPIDAVFMPVTKVNYTVEENYGGDRSQERVIIEVWTNGSINSRQAIDLSVNKIINLFSPLQNVRSIEHEPLVKEKDSKMTEVLVEELDLSVRAYNCLKRAQIHTVSDLLSYSQEDLLEIKNFGRRSAEEVIEGLQKRLGIHLPKEKFTKD